MLFAASIRPRVRAEHSGKSFAEMGRIIADEWQLVKSNPVLYKKYGELADEDQVRYAREMNAYHGTSHSTMPVYARELDSVVRDDRPSADLVASNSTLLLPAIFLDEKTTSVHEQCIVCLDNRKSCFFTPCGHAVLCLACVSESVDKSQHSLQCCVCRQQVHQVHRMYY